MLNTQILSKVAVIGLATSFAVLGATDKAQALDFSFSFDDTTGSNQGEVTGTISGLSDNATNQQPSSITVNSAPASLGFTSFPLTIASTSNLARSNGFNVSGGEITGANTSFVSTNEGIRFNFGAQGLNRLTNRSNNEFSASANGFSGVTYTPMTNTPTPVPFGPAPNMGILILGSMYGASRLRKKFAANQ